MPNALNSLIIVILYEYKNKKLRINGAFMFLVRLCKIGAVMCSVRLYFQINILK